MKVHSRKHVYRFVPNFLDNRRLPAAQQIVILLRSISAAENDSYLLGCRMANQEYSTEKAAELNDARFRKLVSEKFIGVENLEIDGVNVPWDFANFYAEAPQVLVHEVLRVIMSDEVLTLGEQKNFVPESDSHSLPPAAVTNSTAKHATKTTKKPATAATGRN